MSGPRPAWVETLRDHAAAEAKARGHERVEPRHLLAAVAQSWPEAFATWFGAKGVALSEEILEPDGEAVDPPTEDPDVVDLLDLAASDGIDALVAALAEQIEGLERVLPIAEAPSDGAGQPDRAAPAGGTGRSSTDPAATGDEVVGPDAGHAAPSPAPDDLDGAGSPPRTQPGVEPPGTADARPHPTGGGGPPETSETVAPENGAGPGDGAAAGDGVAPGERAASGGDGRDPAAGSPAPGLRAAGSAQLYEPGGAGRPARPAVPTTGGDAGASVRPAADVLAELDGLVGLAPVKAQIRALHDARWTAAERARRGLRPLDLGSDHLAFLGQPGTGKATVAALLAELYASLGRLSRGHVVALDRRDQAGRPAAYTAQATRTRARQAVGGVLFVDEAHALARPGSLGDGDAEAVTALLRAAEEHGDDLVVVLAGRRDEVGPVLAAHPGLAALVGATVEFPPYDHGELVGIFRYFCDLDGVVPAEDLLGAVGALLAHRRRLSGFEHGSEVRVLYRALVAAASARVGSDGLLTDDEEKLTLRVEDLEVARGALDRPGTRRPPGFV